MANRGGVKLGDEAEDEITGFRGTVIAITTWLNGCERISIQPRELHDGKPIDAYPFDVEQVRVIREVADMGGEPAQLAATGGPHPAPSRNPTPRR